MSGRRLLVAAAASVGLLAGCGAALTLTASSQVPSLVASLTKVDSSLVHHRYAEVRTTLNTLIEETRTAESNGSISTAAAARIIDAARELLAQLPHVRVASAKASLPTQQLPSTSPSATPTTTGTHHQTQSKHTQGPQVTSSPSPPSSPQPSSTPSSSPSGTASPAGLATPSP